MIVHGPLLPYPGRDTTTSQLDAKNWRISYASSVNIVVLVSHADPFMFPTVEVK